MLVKAKRSVQNNAEIKESAAKLKSQIDLSRDRINNAEANLHRMMYTSQMMRNLMKDLLDLACMESNTLKINNEFFNLSSVIDQAFIIVDHYAKLKNIQLQAIVPINYENNFTAIYGDERRYL